MTSRRTPIAFNEEFQIILGDSYKNVDQKKLCFDLKSLYMRYSEFSEEIFTGILKILLNGDIPQKIYGLSLIETLSDCLQETHVLNFVNKYLTNVFTQLTTEQNEIFIVRCAKIYEILLRLGGENIAPIIADNLEKSLNMIKGNDSAKKFAALLILHAFLRENPYMSLDKIIVEVEFIWGAARDRKVPNIRDAALNFVNDYIKEISKREKKNTQNQNIKKIFTEIKLHFSNVDYDVIYGNILILKSLLENSPKDIFVTEFNDIVKYILNSKNSKNEKVQKASIESIPALAKYDQITFTKRYSKDFISFLLKSSKHFKSLCYSTIAEILDAHIEVYKTPPDDLIKTIITDLNMKEAGPHVKEIIKCLEFLIKKFASKINDLLDIHDVIDRLLIIQGLTPECLHFFKAACTLEIENITPIIEGKLLLLISYVLKENYIPVQFDENIKAILNAFTQKFKDYSLSKPNIVYSDDYTYQCLHSLATYSWSLYTNFVGILVRETAIKYLDDPSPNVRKKAALVGSLIYKYTENSGSLSQISFMNSINKFLNVAICDPDREVRECVLSSLKIESDIYLRSSNNLKKLYLCLNDNNPHVKIKALEIISRLIPYNPTAIIPTLQNHFYQSIRLTISPEIQFKEKMKAISFLNCFLKNCSWLVREHCDLLTEIILKIFNENLGETAYVIMLDCLATLCLKGNKSCMLKNVDNIEEIASTAMKDLAVTRKRESALKCLSSMISGCEIPILAYYRFPHLIHDIHVLLRQETNIQVRREALRLIGCMGAVDRVLISRVQNRIKEVGLDHSMIPLYIGYDFKTHFSFMNSYQYMNEEENKPLNGRKTTRIKMLEYFENLLFFDHYQKNENSSNYSYILNNWKKLTEKSMVRGFRRNVSNNSDKNNKKNNFEYSLKSEHEFADVILKPPQVIDLSSREFHYTVAIQLLLRKLLDPSYSDLHKLLLDSFNSMVHLLKKEIGNYLNFVLPVLQHYLKRAKPDTTVMILNSILTIVKSRPNFSVIDVDCILNILETYIGMEFLDIQGPNKKNIKKSCFDILLELISFKKNLLKNRLDNLILKIHVVLQNDTEHKDITKLCISIYKKLEDYLETYLDILIPYFCKLIYGREKETNPIGIDTRNEIITLFTTVIIYCPSAFNFVSLIIQALLYNIDCVFQTQYAAMQCLVEIIVRYTNRILVFLPAIDKVVKNRKIPNQDYQKCIETFLETGSIDEVKLKLKSKIFLGGGGDSSLDTSQRKTFYSTATTSTQSDYNKTTIDLTKQTSSTSSSSNQNSDSQIIQLKTQSKIEEIAKLFDISSKVLKEDWLEWLRKTTSELIQLSPNPIVYYFHPLKDYRLISKELFNISFSSAWSILSDTHQSYIVKNLENAIKSIEIPQTVLQSLLNLVEFMSHGNQPLELNVSDMADIAEKCNAYAKAIFYREQEFESSPEKSIESLLSLYSNIGQSDASHGLIEYAKKVLDIDIKMSWFEKLQKWQEALDKYNKVDDDPNNKQDYFVPKMRCLSVLCDWEIVLNKTEPYLLNSSKIDENQLKELSPIAALAALALSRWDKLEKYVDYIREEKDFFKAIVCINKNDLSSAQIHIDKCRRLVDNLSYEAYAKVTEKYVKLQQLVEMEEIIGYKQLENNKSLLEQYKFVNGVHHGVEHMQFEKSRLIRIWNDRLAGCKRSAHYWKEILSIRSLILKKKDNIKIWEKYAKILKGNSNYNMTINIINSIQEEYKEENLKIPYNLLFIKIECEYLCGAANTDESCAKMVELLSLPESDHETKAKYYSKLGRWLFLEYEQEQNISLSKYIDKSLDYYQIATNLNPNSQKIWHNYALTNYNALREHEENPDKLNYKKISTYVEAAINGFIKSLSIGNRSNSDTFEDMLRFLNLLVKYGDLKFLEKLLDDLNIDLVSWIEIVPQLMARTIIDRDQSINKKVHSRLLQLAIKIGNQYPQALLYSLMNAIKSKSPEKRRTAKHIIDELKKNPDLSNIFLNAQLITDELKRLAISLTEEWNEGIDRAYQYFLEKNIPEMVSYLENLHELMHFGPETVDEISFFMNYEIDLREAEAFLQLFKKTEDASALCQAWDIYREIYHKLNDKIKNLEYIHLDYVAPKLITCRNTDVAIPGHYQPNKPIVYIAGFAPTLKVLHSKQHPRKMEIYGDDGKTYHFLLKGHEDIRQDERVMQLFRLVNRLLSKNPSTEKKELSITTFPAIPLSTNCGLLGWVNDCDTLHVLIQEYREKFKIPYNIEKKLQEQFASTNLYSVMPLANKVEIFRYVMDNTKGEDIKRILWMKSPSSEVWLDRRTNYTRSLATMSIVGYILGLGDRHPSNLMLQRYSGLIVHIDFGDCFEVAMRRDKFPERFPFRLTRMLIKAMPASGIEGSYRETCKLVMNVMRENRESVMAVLESFLYDPLVNWRLITAADTSSLQLNSVSSLNSKNLNDEMSDPEKLSDQENEQLQMKNKIDITLLKREDYENHTPEKRKEREIMMAFADEDRWKPTKMINEKAVEVYTRIKKKLVGRDFKDTETLSIDDQVDKLIKQATSQENICQAYSGWCPFWQYQQKIKIKND